MTESNSLLQTLYAFFIQLIGCFKPGALHSVTTAMIDTLTCICFSGLRPEIQATRYAGSR